MSFLLAMWIFIAVLAISTVAALPRRTLQATPCERACNAAQNKPRRLEKIIGEGHDICGCKCPKHREDWTPMHVAARYDCHACLGLLVDPPSNCNKMDGDAEGNTFLHIGAEFCHTATVEEARLWHGFPIDLLNSDRDGDTALCIAASRDNDTCGGVARNLINNGANKCVVCANGSTPCQNAKNAHIRNVLNDEGACSCP